MIKSRAWDKKENRFRYRNQFTVNGDGDIFCNDYGGKCENDRFVVQYYSGMKDRKGNDVYIGDILCETLSEEDASNGSGANIGVVYFAAGCFMIDGNSHLYDHTFSESPDILEDFTVIGNIFENSELLKEVYK